MNENALNTFYNNIVKSDTTFSADYDSFKNGMQDANVRKELYKRLRESNTNFPANDYDVDVVLGFQTKFDKAATEATNKAVSGLRNEKYASLSDDEIYEKWNSMLSKGEQNKTANIEKLKKEDEQFAKQKPFLHAISMAGMQSGPAGYRMPTPIEALEEKQASAFLDPSDLEEFMALDKERGIRIYESGNKDVKTSTIAASNEVKDIRDRANRDNKKLSARERIDLNMAERINDMSQELIEAPSKFGEESGLENWGKGLSDTLFDRDIISVVGMVRDWEVSHIVKKLNDGESLTEAENAMIMAVANFDEVQASRSSDLSVGYQIGQGTAQCVPLIVDMMVTKGLGAAGKRALIKSLDKLVKAGKMTQKSVDRFARILNGAKGVTYTVGKGDDAAKVTVGALEEGAKKTFGQHAGDAARELVETGIQTYAMPSSQRQMIQAKTDLRRESGSNDISFKDRARIFGDAYTQTFTERAGGKAIDWALGKVFGMTSVLQKFGYDRGILKLLNDAVQNPISEIGEEYLGAIINLVRSADLFDIYSEQSNEDLRDEAMSMFTSEGFWQTVGITLPMSLFGGAANYGSIKAETNKYNKSYLELSQYLQKSGMEKNQAENILRQIESAKDNAEFKERMSILKTYLTNYIMENNHDVGVAKGKLEGMQTLLDTYSNNRDSYEEAIGGLKHALSSMSKEAKEKVAEDFKTLVDNANKSITATPQTDGKDVTPADKQSSGWAKKKYSVTIDGKKENVTIQGELFFNEDGSINSTQTDMGKVHIQNGQGKNIRTTVKADKKKEVFNKYLDAINDELRKQKAQKDAEAIAEQKAEEARKAELAKIKADEKAKVDAENAKLEEEKQAIVQQEADRQNIIASFPKDKNGDVDIDKMSPEQFFVYESDTDTPEAAMNTVGDVLNDLYQQLENNANETNKEKRARNAAKIKNRIRQYEAVVVKYAGKETLDNINAARAEALKLNTPPVPEGAPVVAPVVEQAHGEVPAPAQPKQSVEGPAPDNNRVVKVRTETKEDNGVTTTKYLAHRYSAKKGRWKKITDGGMLFDISLVDENYLNDEARDNVLYSTIKELKESDGRYNATIKVFYNDGGSVEYDVVLKGKPELIEEYETPEKQSEEKPDAKPKVSKTTKPITGETGGEDVKEIKPIDLSSSKYVVLRHNSKTGKEAFLIAEQHKNEDGSVTYTSPFDGGVIDAKAYHPVKKRYLGLDTGKVPTPVIVLSLRSNEALKNASGNLKYIPIVTTSLTQNKANVLDFKYQNDDFSYDENKKEWKQLKNKKSKVLLPSESASIKSLDSVLAIPVLPHQSVVFTLGDLLQTPTEDTLRTRLHKLGLSPSEYSIATIKEKAADALNAWRNMVRNNRLNEHFTDTNNMQLGYYNIFRDAVVNSGTNKPSLFVQSGSKYLLESKVENPLVQLAVLADVASQLGLVEKRDGGWISENVRKILEKTQDKSDKSSETKKEKKRVPSKKKVAKESPVNMEELQNNILGLSSDYYHIDKETRDKVRAKITQLADSLSESNVIALYDKLISHKDASDNNREKQNVDAAIHGLRNSKHGNAVVKHEDSIASKEEKAKNSKKGKSPTKDRATLLREAKRAALIQQLEDAEDIGERDLAEQLRKQIDALDAGANLSELMANGRVVEDKISAKRIINILKAAGVRVVTIKESELHKYVRKESLEQLKDGDVVYGVAGNDIIYIVEEHLNPNTPLHEFTHMWVRAFKQTFANEWKRFVEIANKSELANKLRAEGGVYVKISDEDMASEVLSRYTGYLYGELDSEGRTAFENEADVLKDKSLIDAIRDFWRTIISWFDKNILNHDDQDTIDEMIRQFAQAPMATLARGREAVDEMKQLANQGYQVQSVYHGTQANFSQFDHDFMGSGEGAQAYGWGTYVSQVKNVSVDYANRDSQRKKNEIYKQFKNEIAEYDDGVRDLIERYSTVALVSDAYAGLGVTTPNTFKEFIDDQTKIIEENISLIKAILSIEYPDMSQEDINSVMSNMGNGRWDELTEPIYNKDYSSEGIWDTINSAYSRIKILEETLPYVRRLSQEEYSRIDGIVERFSKSFNNIKRVLYQVSIPSEAYLENGDVDINNSPYLGWDDHYEGSEVSESIISMFSELEDELTEEMNNIMASGKMRGEDFFFEDPADEMMMSDITDALNAIESISERLAAGTRKVTGGQIYGALHQALGSQKAASEYLLENGFLGVRVSIRATSGKMNDKKNYVIFNEADAVITDSKEFMIDRKSNNISENFDKSEKSTTFVPTSELPISELEAARSALFMRRNLLKDGSELVIVNSSNYFHIGRGEDEILASFDIEDRETLTLIREVLNEINEGTEGFDFLDEKIRSKQGNNSSSDSRTERLEDRNAGNDGVSSNEISEPRPSSGETDTDVSEYDNLGEVELMVGPAAANDTEEKIKKASEDVESAFVTADVSLPDKTNALAKLATAVCDSGEAFRQFMKALRKYRKKNYLGKLPEGRDIRQIYDNQRVVLKNKIEELLKLYETPLEETLEKLIKVVENSSMYKKYQEDRVVYTIEEEDANGKITTKTWTDYVEITPREFIERYLIACDSVERLNNGIPPRGLREFYSRMGVNVYDFQMEFEAAFASDGQGEALVKELWQRINAYTNYTLEDSYECGMLTEEEYNKRKARKFYVPERDFQAEKELEQTEIKPQKHYRSNKLASSKQAKGGDSLAANIIENMIHIGNIDLSKNNKNRVKLAMFNLLKENEDFRRSIGLPKPEEVWYDSDGKRVSNKLSKTLIERIKWLESQIAEYDSLIAIEESQAVPDTVEIAQLEKEMQDLIDERNGIPYMLEYDARDKFFGENNPHMVGVYVDGVLCSMQFPNMQLIATALNDTWADSMKLRDWIKKGTGYLGSIITTYEPTFFAVNTVTDSIAILTKGYVELGLEYSARFIATTKDLGKHMSLITAYMTGKDYRSMENGDLFRDFLMNGGNTGYATIRNMETILEELQVLDNKSNHIKDTKKWLKKTFSFTNESAELLLRFAAYKAAIDCGYGVEKATWAANNLSANFNRTGKKFNDTKFGWRALGEAMEWFKSLSMFTNPAIQGAMSYLRMFGDSGELSTKEQVDKYFRLFNAAMFMPVLCGFLNAMMFDDDEQEEWAVSEYDRANYLILGKKGKIPVPHMIRPFYNIGVNIAMGMQGRRTGGDIADSIITSFLTHLTPLPPVLTETASKGVHSAFGNADFTFFDGIESLVTPQGINTLKELADGENFLGYKVRYEGSTAQYTKNPNAGAFEKIIAEQFYIWGGGIEGSDSKITDDGNTIGRFRDVSPNEMKSVMQLLLPKTVIDVANFTAGAINDEHDVRLKDVPIVNRFVSDRTKEAYRAGIYSEANKITKANDIIAKAAKGDIERLKIDLGKASSEEERVRIQNEIDFYKGIYKQAKGDVVAITIEKNLEKYKRIRMASLHKEYHHDEKSFKKLYPDLEYDVIEDAEKMFTFNMFQLVCMYNGTGKVNDNLPNWMKDVFRINPSTQDVNEMWEHYQKLQEENNERLGLSEK